MGINSFEEEIKPFFWVEHPNSFSVCLNVGEYKNELFETREDEGFEGNGYDWASLARVFLSEKMEGLAKVVKFDPEGSMFCAYSEDKVALQSFITSFKNACEDNILIQDLFSRAELD
ncbi:immunity 51 family protein [Rapidithrix thailandica]|uniref:Immunity 51 family protein n=1 Tax=Rapidithrix thailandica TaxID=413964 RepID=A0AAW9S433_9BACT